MMQNQPKAIPFDISNLLRRKRLETWRFSACTLQVKHGIATKKGFTLIELIIVLALLAVIGGIVAPNFIGTTEKARLRSDVQSARIIQSALELYQAENGTVAAGADVKAKIAELQKAGYLSKGEWTPQTKGTNVAWVLEDGIVKISIGGLSLDAIVAQLTDQEKVYIKK